MAEFQPRESDLEAVEAATREWRQGDLTLEVTAFAHLADPARPLTAAAGELQGGEPQVALSECRGLVVLTQTCDIRRSAADRPFVQVSPVIVVSESLAREVERGYWPRYAAIPSLANHVADLERVMTVEKSVLGMWTRAPGWSSDAEIRRFAKDVARRYARFAFPDDFAECVRPLQTRLREKHDKQSDEGRALRMLREIRVTPNPSWNADSIEVFLSFIHAEGATPPAAKAWDWYLEKWLGLCRPKGCISAIDGAVFSLETLTAREYVDSDPLDLDHLTLRDSEGNEVEST